VSVLSELVRVTAPTSAGTQEITGLGFQPKALIVWTVDADAIGLSTGRANFGIGFCDSTLGQGNVSSIYADEANPDDNGRGQDAYAFGQMADNIQWRALGEVTVLGADGFTIDWVDPPGDSTTFHVLAIGGDGVNATKYLNPQIPGTGVQGYTGAGFTPNAMLMACGHLTYVGRGGNALVSVMMADADTAYGVSWGMRDNVSPVVAVPYARENNAAATAHVFGGASLINRSEFVSLDADGFTLEHFSGGANEYLHALLLDVDEVSVEIDTVPTVDGEEAFTTGFVPGAGLFLAPRETADDAENANTPANVAAAFGAFDAAGDGMAAGFSSENGVAVSSVDRNQTNKAAMVFDKASDTYVDGEVTTLTTSGLIVDWSGTDPSNAYRYARMILGAPFVAVAGAIDPTIPSPVVKPSA
jgi:hypothetical protein